MFDSIVEKIILVAQEKLSFFDCKRLKWINEYSVSRNSIMTFCLIRSNKILLKKTDEMLIVVLARSYSRREFRRFIKELEFALEISLFKEDHPFITYNGYQVNDGNLNTGQNASIYKSEFLSPLKEKLAKYLDGTRCKSDQLKNEFAIANFNIEEIKSLVNDSIKILLKNNEDLQVLETNSLELRENIHLFKRKLRSTKRNGNMKNSMFYPFLFSMISLLGVLLIVKK